MIGSTHYSSRNRKPSFICLLIGLCFSLLNADTFPFNKSHTHVGIPYTTLQLSKEQEFQIERSRTLTLTKPQLALLKKIGPACPENLEVMPSYFDDCSCGMAAIAVWFKPGEIEVPHSFLPKHKDELADLEPYDVFNHGLVIDPDGDFWYRGNKLNLEAAKSKIIEIEKRSWRHGTYSAYEKPCGFVSTPPKKCIRNFPRIQTQLKNLESALVPDGFTLYAPEFATTTPNN